jgi:hypothetical protein
LVHHLCHSTGFIDDLRHCLSLVHHLCNSTGFVDQLYHCLSLENDKGDEPKKDNGKGDQQNQ